MNVGQRVTNETLLRGTVISVPYSRPSHLAVDIRWDDGRITTENHRDIRIMPMPGRHRKTGAWRYRLAAIILPRG